MSGYLMAHTQETYTTHITYRADCPGCGNNSTWHATKNRLTGQPTYDITCLRCGPVDTEGVAA